MSLRSSGEGEATGRVAEIHGAQRSRLGFVMEATRCFIARPELPPLHTDFSGGVRSGFSPSPRDWRLITLTAAKHVPSTYCSYVYGQQMIADLGSEEAVMAVQRDFRTAGLPDRAVEMLAYAEKVAKDASRVSRRDIERSRGVGFGDREICDIALCAAFRCFVSRFLDAAGAGPEAASMGGDGAFRTAMTVGRAC